MIGIMAKYPRVTEFDVELGEPGTRTNLFVELIHDGLGRAVGVPIVLVRGKRPGPVFGITCALHGNELNGIPVVHRLIETVDPEKLRGTMVACPVLNIPGFTRNEREYRDGKDLNHLMPGKEHGNESQFYAHRLVERLVSKFDVLLDLHTASFGRVNSLYVRADMTNPVTAQMAYLQHPKIILHNPPSDFTLRGTADELGIPAITVEIGDPQVFQPRHIKPTIAGARAVMSHFGILKSKPRVQAAEPILATGSSWMFTDFGGLLEVLPEVATTVEEGELVARQLDIFGAVVREYHAPFDGVVIGKSVNPVSPTGARILHLGRLGDLDGLVTPEAAAEQSKVDK